MSPAELWADELIAWAREHRPDIPRAGDLRDPKLTAELFRASLVSYYSQHPPQADVPARVELWADGVHVKPEQPAPAFDAARAASADAHAFGLALGAGFYQDI